MLAGWSCYISVSGAYGVELHRTIKRIGLSVSKASMNEVSEDASSRYLCQEGQLVKGIELTHRVHGSVPGRRG